MYVNKSILSKRDAFLRDWRCTVYNGRAILLKNKCNAFNNVFVIWRLFLRREKKYINKIVNRVWCEKIEDSIFRPYRPALLCTNSWRRLEQINKQNTKTFMILAKDDHWSTWTIGSGKGRYFLMFSTLILHWFSNSCPIFVFCWLG